MMLLNVLLLVMSVIDINPPAKNVYNQLENFRSSRNVLDYQSNQKPVYKIPLDSIVIYESQLNLRDRDGRKHGKWISISEDRAEIQISFYIHGKKDGSDVILQDINGNGRYDIQYINIFRNGVLLFQIGMSGNNIRLLSEKISRMKDFRWGPGYVQEPEPGYQEYVYSFDERNHLESAGWWITADPFDEGSDCDIVGVHTYYDGGGNISTHDHGQQIE